MTIIQKGEKMNKDMIYRQEAIDALDCVNGTEEVLRSLPSAQPERKPGKWIPHKSIFGGLGEKVYTCNQCGYNIGFHTENFCPNCGADMRTAKHGTKIDLCIMDEVEGRT